MPKNDSASTSTKIQKMVLIMVDVDIVYRIHAALVYDLDMPRFMDKKPGKAKNNAPPHAGRGLSASFEASRPLQVSDRASALAHFKKVDLHFYRATKSYHTSLPLKLSGRRTTAQLFESLVSIVIAQQLGTAAADTIFERVKKMCGSRLSPESVLKARIDAFRKAGLSGAKTKTLKAIAMAVKEKTLKLLSLRNISEKDAAEKLLQVWGLGPWSVEMFLMNSLGCADVFSPGDLGLVRAMEAIYGLPKNTPRTSLLKISEKWSPYRTYACLLLWRSRG